MKKILKFSFSLNHTPNWIAQHSITIYEYDGVKICIYAFPKQVKNQLNDHEPLEIEELKVDANSTIINDIDTPLKSKSPKEIEGRVL